MSEKFAEVLLPPTNGQVTSIPQDAHQLTVKDGIIFIGKEPSKRTTDARCRYLMVICLLLILGAGAMIIKPGFHQLFTIVLVTQTDGSRDNPLVDRSTTESSTSTSTMTLISTESKVTILYSMTNPASSLSTYYQITSVYVARSYQTTLSFFMQNGPSWTYLDDVSVTTSSGSQLLINGNFENSTVPYGYGWSGANIDGASNAHTGMRCHKEGTSAGHSVSQTFITIPGNALNISFWILWGGSGAGVATKAIIY